MLETESDSSPWMSRCTPTTSNDRVALPRCAVLSFHREGDKVHWKPWRNSSTPSTPSTPLSITNSVETFDESPRGDVDAVLDLTSVLAVAVKHGMTAPAPAPTRRKFGWSRKRRGEAYVHPDCAAPAHCGRSSNEVKNFTWIGPSPTYQNSPRSTDSPVSYREFSTACSSPVELAVGVYNGRKSRCLDSPGLALTPWKWNNRAQSSMSEGMTLHTRGCDGGRKSRRKRLYRKFCTLFSPSSCRNRRLRRSKTSDDLCISDSEDGDLHRASTDVYMEFMCE